MFDTIQLKKFLDAQNQLYLKALSEIKSANKQSHWMWFIFPQLKGLGRSETAMFYAINNLREAAAYLAHPVLGKHLVETSNELLNVKGKSATEIFGSPDDMKLRSSMTLFANVPDTNPIFEKVIDYYFDGLQDELTLQLLLKNKLQNDTV
ncbi:MAG TPA: DUF1810 domain-containing protein [Flavobacterium sp.]|jgi:uncharacterized protein (DUF1810 family)